MANPKKIKNKKAISHFDFNRTNTFAKSKRSQIGSTLSWFVGFLVIFFVMFLFIASTLILSEMREIKIKKTIYSPEALESQRVLFNFLGTKTIYNGQEIAVKELIKKWATGTEEDSEKLIKQDFENLVKDKDFACFIFRAEFKDKKVEVMDLSKYRKDIPELSGYGKRARDLTNQATFLRKGSNLFLISQENSLIDVGFYGGNCLLI